VRAERVLQSNIAYGGHTLAQCIASACAEVPDGYFLFSAVGTFLSAVTQDVPLHFEVDSIRSTKTFRTIRVEAYQETSPGKERMVMFCCASCLMAILPGQMRPTVCDFQAKEKDIMFDHSPQPWHDYSPPERLPHLNDLVDQKLKSGELTPEVAEAIRRQNPLVHLNDFRLCPESMAAQKWIGVTPEVRTTQDHLPMHQRSSAVWLKTWYPITNHADQVATIG
jgi:acyl-CoA thioesterase